MKKTMKIVGSVLTIVVISAFVFCTVWTVRNWDKVYASLDGTSIYTAEDIKKAKEDTWAEAASNEKEKDNTISDLRELVSSLQTTHGIEMKKMQQSLDEYIYIFNSLKASVENVELADRAVLVFISDDKIINVGTVEKNSTFTDELPTPSREGYHFIGWSLNGVDIIDLNTYEFTQNTTLTAVFEINVYTVKFVGVYGSNKVDCGETQVTHGGYVNPETLSVANQNAMNFCKTIPIDPNIENAQNATVEFDGWTFDGYYRTYKDKDGKEIITHCIDFNNYQVESNLEIKVCYSFNCGSIYDLPAISDDFTR